VSSLAALLGACASTPGARPKPFPMPSAPPVVEAAPESAPGTGAGAGSTLPPAPQPMTAVEAALIGTALELRGIPYRNGGSDPSGFDCSGFTQWVFARHGLVLPREVKDQFRTGERVDADELAPGDLVFFATTSRSASHVGIALGDDTFVHAPSSRGVVRVEHLSSSYWSKRFLGVRRILTDAEEVTAASR
jgi:cell wall-associated NlpC family hydrolase